MSQTKRPAFNPDCRDCPRLASFLDQVGQKHPEYHARPVAPFGDRKPRLLIVGLAPGMHGANATGRPFTGDHAGILLYETLHRFGFANHPQSTSRSDGLKLNNCRITNAVKCLPPENKPRGSEITCCNHYLQYEIKQLSPQTVILVLGRIAHNAVLKALGLKQSHFSFKHGALYSLPEDLYLLDSYHCSRYNTQTGRLSKNMFNKIFYKIVEIIDLTN